MEANAKVTGYYKPRFYSKSSGSGWYDAESVALEFPPLPFKFKVVLFCYGFVLFETFGFAVFTFPKVWYVVVVIAGLILWKMSKWRNSKAYFAWQMAAWAWGWHRYDRCVEYAKRIDAQVVPEADLVLAQACVMAGRYKEALAAYKRYQANGGVLRDSALYGAAWAMVKEDPKWVLDLTSCLVLNEMTGPIRAQALMYLGRPTAAIETCLQVLNGRQTVTEEMKAVWYLLGLAYEAAGDKHRATKVWSKLYAHEPTFRDVEKRLMASKPQ